MSSTPGISPITPDIEELRHRDEKRDLVADEQADDPAMDEEGGHPAEPTPAPARSGRPPDPA